MKELEGLSLEELQELEKGLLSELDACTTKTPIGLTSKSEDLFIMAFKVDKEIKRRQHESNSSNTH